MARLIIILLLALPGFITCIPETSIQFLTNTCKIKRTDDTATISILFVGNSLTYINDLPSMVETIGTQNNKSIKTEMLALPNYSLEDHWLEGKVQDIICKGNFDFVVVQQGPSSQTLGRGMLLQYGMKLKEVCDSRGSQLAFFMVWPAIVNYKTFDGVVANYTAAAKETKSLLCPVGAIWKEYIAQSNDYSYYSSDGFHPSLKGSEFAAEIIYKTLIPK